MEQLNKREGCIYVVATPIGNLEDITRRAIRVLTTASVIGCENVQRTKALLRRLQIETTNKNFIVLNDARETVAMAQVLELIKVGQDVVIVSDSGTPLVSDPGFQLVRAAHNARIRTLPVPGPSALAALVSICPIPLRTYLFCGFLPRKGKSRREQLLSIKNATVPTVVFESPHRFLQTLQDLLALDMENREVFLGREMTKQFEEYLHTTVALLYDNFLNRPHIKGELTLVIDRGEESKTEWSEEQLTKVLLPYLRPAQVATILVELKGLTRAAAYSTVVSRAGQALDGKD